MLNKLPSNVCKLFANSIL